MSTRPLIELISLDLQSDKGIENANKEVSRSLREWALLVPGDAEISRNIIIELERVIGENPHADIIYGDEDGPSASGFPILKPAFNPDMLMACNYIGWPVAIRKDAFVELGGFRTEFGRSADHALWLRAWAFGKNFVRHTSRLIRFGSRNEPPEMATVQRVVSAFCDEFRPDLEVLPGLTERTVQVRKSPMPYPDVTIVVPTRQSPCGETAGKGEKPDVPHIRYFLDSLCRSTWPMDKLNVLVVDDAPDEDIYENADWPFRFRRIYTPRPDGMPFNYSRKMNRALGSVETEAVVLMNDDIRIDTDNWLEALMTFALDPDVGGVGARLMYPDGCIQHAGVVGGLYGNVAHAWLGENGDAPTYQDWALVHRNWSMVTGAVFATRLSVLAEVGGFSENFAVEYNDLDLCLRIGMLGYRIVYTPHAQLYHYEKSSRGNAGPSGSEMARFRLRWMGIIEDDPAFHPDLSRNSFRIEVR